MSSFTDRPQLMSKEKRESILARIEYLRGLPWTQDRSRSIQHMQAFLQKMT